MFKGIMLALTACLIWGLIFIVPLFMEGFSAIEVALGRYLVFGVVSLLILAKTGIRKFCQYPLEIWGKALIFSLVSTMVYYISVVLALRFATPAICTLILGVSPITIAFYGNWRMREYSFKTLIPPSILIMLGLVIINFPQFQLQQSGSQYGLGLFFSLIGLISWSWFVVENSRFLKNNPEIPAFHWSTLIGVTTLFWTLFFGLISAIIFIEFVDVDKYLTMDESFIKFAIGCGVLGVICSWLGSYLWNQACFYLPVSLAGQLTIFETIFGVLFVYIVAGEMPLLIECVGIVVLLAAVIYGLILTNEKAVTVH